jgi:succinyl-CoA synthetase alpha subunit
MINGNEKVCVQGITGKYGKFHTKKWLNMEQI